MKHAVIIGGGMAGLIAAAVAPDSPDPCPYLLGDKFGAII